MVYTKRNTLLKAKAVQDITFPLQKKGVTNKHIYHNHVYPAFFISNDTFYRYLKMDVEKELKEFNQQEKNND